MRVRNIESKILGSATYNPPPRPPLPRPPPAAQFRASSSALPAPAGQVLALNSPVSVAAEVSLEMICVVNRSPWDILTPDLDYFQDFVGVDSKEQKTTISVGKMKVEGGIGSSSAAVVREKKAKKRNLSLEKKPTEPKTNDNMKSCKKNDGKGWHCKQIAAHPHTLCSYHLSQVRSYADNRAAVLRAAAAASTESSVAPPSTGTSSAAAKGQAKKQKKKPRRSGSTAVDKDDLSFLFYTEFGPWRSKNRSEASPVAEAVEPAGAGGGIQMGEAQEKEKVHVPDHAEVINKLDGKREDGPVAGDDEKDDGGQPKEEEMKKNGRKRGRKPMKARSLKSLL